MAAKDKDGSILILALLAGGAYLLFSKKDTVTAPASNQANPPAVDPAIMKGAGAGTPSLFIAENTGLAELLASQYGIPVDSTLAMGGLESGWGESDAKAGAATAYNNANNVFGILADSSWKGDTWRGFRKYASIADSFDDFGKFLSTQPNYAAAFGAHTVDPIEFVSLIATAGYGGPDPSYLSNVTDCVKLVKGFTGQ